MLIERFYRHIEIFFKGQLLWVVGALAGCSMEPITLVRFDFDRFIFCLYDAISVSIFYKSF